MNFKIMKDFMEIFIEVPGDESLISDLFNSIEKDPDKSLPILLNQAIRSFSKHKNAMAFAQGIIFGICLASSQTETINQLMNNIKIQKNE